MTVHRESAPAGAVTLANPGVMHVLNVGDGDTKLSFDPKNPAERIRAARIVKDMRELPTCDAIALMPGLERSNGAHLELHVAHRLSMEVIHLPLQFDLVAHIRRQASFSERTFGPGSRVAGLCEHIRKELIEVEDEDGPLSAGPLDWPVVRLVERGTDDERRIRTDERTAARPAVRAEQRHGGRILSRRLVQQLRTRQSNARWR